VKVVYDAKLKADVPYPRGEIESSLSVIDGFLELPGESSGDACLEIGFGGGFKGFRIRRVRSGSLFLLPGLRLEKSQSFENLAANESTMRRLQIQLKMRGGIGGGSAQEHQ